MRAQGVYVSRIAGTSVSLVTVAWRGPAPPVPLGADTVKRTCIVSSAQVNLGIGANPGHAAPGAPDEKLAVPVVTPHRVTVPPAPTCISKALPMLFWSPIVPVTDVGAVPPALCAKPLTSMRFASLDGSSSATSVQVEDEPPGLETTR